MDDDAAAIEAYYNRAEERNRLVDGPGLLEFLRTTEVIARHLPPPPALVADIGGGPGRYTLWLASLGYQVEHRDLMPLHVTQLQADAPDHPGIHTAVGDARHLDLPDKAADAVLLLGPLYHLPRTERIAALREAARILRPGAPLFAAAITPWAFRIDGLLANRIYLKYPAALDVVDEAERAGFFPPIHGSSFTSYTHRPAELRAELTEAGFDVASLVCVEGPAVILPDLSDRLTDPADRAVILDGARALEDVPDLLGFGPHLLATGTAPG